MIDGSAVKRAREAAHLTQAGLAKAAQTVSAIEQGRLKWTKFLPQLARVREADRFELAVLDRGSGTERPLAAFNEAFRDLVVRVPEVGPPVLSPDGKRVAVPGVVFYRIRDGKIAEFRGSFDMLSMLRQLGAFPSAPPA